MSATTLNWAAINLNGKVIPKMGLLGSCSIRCEWIQARCRLVIMGPGMETIELYVEVDVTSITYSILGPRAIGAPIIILSVELSRPTNWAGNGDNVWQGDIGIRLDNLAPWSPALHQEMVDSICSCFEGVNEIHPILNEIAHEKFKNIGAPPPKGWEDYAYKHFRDLDQKAMSCLAPGQLFTGDVLITGLRDWCVGELFKAHPDHPPVHVFSNYMYKKFVKGDLKQSTLELDHRAKCQKDYVVLPLHLERKHWALAILIKPSNASVADGEPAIIAIFDSMSNLDTFTEVCSVLQRWLVKVYKIPPARLNIRMVHVKVPQQQNLVDCGPFVVHYAQTFFSDAAAYSRHILRTDLNHAEVNELWKVENLPSLRSRFIQYIEDVEMELL